MSNNNNAPAFQHYPGDFLSDPYVQLMTSEEVGMYWLLVNWCWKLGGLPDDLDALAVYARASKEGFERIWTARISSCFEKKNGRWIHPHLEDQRRKHRQRKKQTSEAASVRWSKQKGSDDANAMQTHCETDAKKNPPALQTQCISSSISSSSSSSSSVEDSVNAIALTGAVAPEGGEEEEYYLHRIWKDGLRMLTATGGMSERAARGFLGKLVKEHGNEKLAEAVSNAMARNAINPQEYLVGLLREKPRFRREEPYRPSTPEEIDQLWRDYADGKIG